MIPLYEGMSRRLGEKHLPTGKWREKLEYGARLKPGDLISSCKGYNEIIREVEPEYWQGLKPGKKVVIDFGIETTVGSCCSLTHCCTVPLETKEQVVDYWLRDCDEWAINFYGGEEKWKTSLAYLLREDLRAGVEVFNADGTIHRDYSHYWCAFREDGTEACCFTIRKQAEKLVESGEAVRLGYKVYDFEKYEWKVEPA
jgi:hypothetical protein